MARLTKFLVLAITALLLLAVPVLATLLSNSPTACSGQWTSCTNAFANDANRATASVSATANKTGIWNNYGFNIPSSASIDSVLVRADFFASQTSGYINIRTSNNGGAALGPSHVVGGNTAEQTFWVDVTNDFAWTSAMLNSGNLVTNVTCFRQGSKNPTCNLDWLPVNVTYTPFNFSVSANPNSGSVHQTEAIATTVDVTKLSGGTATVDLSYSGCPTGTTCSFNPTTGTPTYSSTFNMQTSASTPAGTYQVRITGTGDGLTRNVNYTLSVTDSIPVASASANPTSGVTPLEVNFTGSVAGGDAPLTYFWDFKDGTNSTSQSPQHTFTVAGTYNASFTVTDSDGDVSTSYAAVVVNEPFDFSVSADPTSGTASQGSSANTTLTATLLSGISQLVSLSYSGCPPSANCSFNPASGNPTYASLFTVATAGNTTIGDYVITLTGTGGSLVRSVNYTLSVV
jgi:PKD repeat protein